MRQGPNHEPVCQVKEFVLDPGDTGNRLSCLDRKSVESMRKTKKQGDQRVGHRPMGAQIKMRGHCHHCHWELSAMHSILLALAHPREYTGTSRFL